MPLLSPNSVLVAVTLSYGTTVVLQKLAGGRYDKGNLKEDGFTDTAAIDDTSERYIVLR